MGIIMQAPRTDMVKVAVPFGDAMFEYEVKDGLANVHEGHVRAFTSMGFTRWDPKANGGTVSAAPVEAPAAAPAVATDAKPAEPTPADLQAPRMKTR